MGWRRVLPLVSWSECYRCSRIGRTHPQSLESLIFSASDGSEYRVTGTFGVAGLVSGMSSEALLAAADRALYYAKQQGRNRIGDASFIAPFVASSKRSPQTQLGSPSAPFSKAEEPSATPP